MADLRDEVLAEVRRLLAAELEREGQVDLSHRLATDLEVDSMGAIVLAVGLEDRFRVALAEEDTAGVVTVQDLVDVVVRRIDETRAVPDPADGGAGSPG